MSSKIWKDPEPDRRELFMNAMEGERMKQDAIWGGVEHDQSHAFTDWGEFIDLRVGRLKALLSEQADAQQSGYRLLIEIAALACAAYEAECGP